jgi:hypothetical protein
MKRTRPNPEAWAYWRAAVTAGGCIMPPPHDGPIDPHHVVSQQELKKRGLEKWLTCPDNGIGLCRRHHANHETAFARVPRHLLPPSAVAFAERLGLGYYIERFYPEMGRAREGREAPFAKERRRNPQDHPLGDEDFRNRAMGEQLR